MVYVGLTITILTLKCKVDKYWKKTIIFRFLEVRAFHKMPVSVTLSEIFSNKVLHSNLHFFTVLCSHVLSYIVLYGHL